jgi:Holliday junction resolvasome RuvABC ATP-dependent DNA helicase subunit
MSGTVEYLYPAMEDFEIDILIDKGRTPVLFVYI